jgi:lipoprotein-anchoring transpeptidase ErfK/SrfK
MVFLLKHPQQRAASRLLSSLAMAALLGVTTTACSTESTPTAGPTKSSEAPSGNAALPNPPSSVTASPTTPNGLPPVAKTQGTEAATQTAVSAAVIDTPNEVLNTAVESSTVNVNDDVFTPTPKGKNIVLEAVVPKVVVYKSSTSKEVLTTLDNPLPSGAPLTLLVDGSTSSRYKALLPIRPNGSQGWIDPGQVKKYETDYHIQVKLSEHKITVFKGSSIVLDEKIATGTSDTPSPNGRYYIKELLRACKDQKGADGVVKCVPYDDGVYGPYAYGLSGFSPVLTSFNGGEGVIGIHGTNQPELLGKNVSHGCIRMSNSGITTLASILPLGTPVDVLS